MSEAVLLLLFFSKYELKTIIKQRQIYRIITEYYHYILYISSIHNIIFFLAVIIKLLLLLFLTEEITLTFDIFAYAFSKAYTWTRDSSATIPFVRVIVCANMASLDSGNSAASIRHEYIVDSENTYPRPLVFRQRLEQYRMVEGTVFRAQAAVSEKQTLPKGTIVITTGETIEAYELNNSLEVFGVFEKPLLKDNEQVNLLVRYVKVVEMK